MTVRGGRILLIDDDDRFRRVVHVMLTTAGYVVQDARMAKSLASYRQERSDVVIPDILMPEREGLETIRALTRLDPDVKIIAISAGGEGPSGYLQTAVTFGAGRILHKPFSRDQLLSTLADVLG